MQTSVNTWEVLQPYRPNHLSQVSSAVPSIMLIGIVTALESWFPKESWLMTLMTKTSASSCASVSSEFYDLLSGSMFEILTPQLCKAPSPWRDSPACKWEPWYNLSHWALPNASARGRLIPEPNPQALPPINLWQSPPGTLFLHLSHTPLEVPRALV